VREKRKIKKERRSIFINRKYLFLRGDYSDKIVLVVGQDPAKAGQESTTA
jgi:hypothetical protein